MKSLQFILKRKKNFTEEGEAKELDEKTVARVFLEAAKREIKNLEDADVQEVKLKGSILYIKTAHPVISSELIMRKEKIIREINEIAKKRLIEKIVVS